MAIVNYEPRHIEITPMSSARMPSQHEFEIMKLYAEAAGASSLVNQRPADAMLIILQGWELGLSPMQSLNMIYIVNGKPSLSTALIHALVRKSGALKSLSIPDIKDIENEATVTAVRVDDEQTYSFTYTTQDAATAGLANKDNWKRMKKQMLLNRALNGCLRLAAPEIVAGFYPVEELAPDIPVNEDGEPLPGTPPVIETPQNGAHARKPAPPNTDNTTQDSTPQNGAHAPQTAPQNAAHWSDDAEKLAALEKHIRDTFNVSMDTALAVLDAFDWYGFETGKAAFAGLLNAVRRGELPIVARDAKYIKTGVGNSTALIFVSALNEPIYWYKGREALAREMSNGDEIDEKWAAITEWELQTAADEPRPLLEPVEIYVKTAHRQKDHSAYLTVKDILPCLPF